MFVCYLDKFEVWGVQLQSAAYANPIFFSYGSTAPSGPGPPRFRRGFETHTQSVGLLWTRDQSVAETST